jgi:hypothetical protein
MINFLNILELRHFYKNAKLKIRLDDIYGDA